LKGFEPTHSGVLCYCNGAVSLRHRIPLRATPKQFTTKYGSRFRRADGTPAASKGWNGAHVTLDLATIRELHT
jgi:hypothetical protein